MAVDEELVKKGYRPVPPEDIQPLLLDILKAFDAYCARHDLAYGGIGGTMLGAVRHGGFIPWDDDIDVYMMHKDYERLIELARKDPYLDEDHRYKILIPATFPNIYYFIKIVDCSTLAFERTVDRTYAIGLWLDVFCYVPVPSDLKEQARITAKRDRYILPFMVLSCNDQIQSPYNRFYPLFRLMQKAGNACGLDVFRYAQKILDIQDSLTEPTDTIGEVAWGSYQRNNYPALWFGEMIRVPFEDMELPIPAHYDEILTKTYGNWHELPPVEERHTHDPEVYYVPQAGSEAPRQN